MKNNVIDLTDPIHWVREVPSLESIAGITDVERNYTDDELDAALEEEARIRWAIGLQTLYHNINCLHKSNAADFQGELKELLIEFHEGKYT